MNTDNAMIRLTDLAENAMARLPITLVLDVSGSMAGKPLEELNKGLVTFFTSLQDNPIASRSAEVSITFFADEPELVLDFTSLKRVTEVPQITRANGGTNLEGGVNTALDAMNRCRHDMRATGVDHYKPFLVIMSDGSPNIGDYRTAAQRVRELEDDHRIVVFPIGIGPAADLNVLAEFSKRGSLKLQNLEFRAFFEWLSRSVAVVSASQLGDTVRLPKEGVDKWMEI